MSRPNRPERGQGTDRNTHATRLPGSPEKGASAGNLGDVQLDGTVRCQINKSHRLQGQPENVVAQRLCSTCRAALCQHDTRTLTQKACPFPQDRGPGRARDQIQQPGLQNERRSCPSAAMHKLASMRVHGSGVRVLQSTFSGYSHPGNKPGPGFRKRMRHVPQCNPGHRAGEMTSQGTAHNAPGTGHGALSPVSTPAPGSAGTQ